MQHAETIAFAGPTQTIIDSLSRKFLKFQTISIKQDLPQVNWYSHLFRRIEFYNRVQK